MPVVRHGSLSASTVATVSLTRTSTADVVTGVTAVAANQGAAVNRFVDKSFDQIEIVNRGTVDIFFNFVTFVDGNPAATPVAPTIGGNDCHVVAPGSSLVVSVPSQLITTVATTRTYEIRVRMIAASANAYSVVVP